MNNSVLTDLFDMFNSLYLAPNLLPFIQLKKGRAPGTENQYSLLHAIKNKLRKEYPLKLPC